MSAPLVVNTRDGVCWTRRAVTSGGIALYAPERFRTAPEFVMATLTDLAEQGIVGSADVLPVPVAPEPQASSAERLRVERNRYRIAWRMARTRALSTGSAADRYAARARDAQDALQHMLFTVIAGQMALKAATDRVAELEDAAQKIVHLHKDSPMGPCPVCIDGDAMVRGDDYTLPYPCPTARLAGAKDCDPPSYRTADFFQPGHAYTHRPGPDSPGGPRLRFYCESVTTDKATGQPVARGWGGRRYGDRWTSVQRARGLEDWQSGQWVDTTDGEREPAAPLTVFRASHDSIVMGLYTTAAEARKHCEAEERRAWAKHHELNFDWIVDEEDGVAEMTAFVGGEECTTGYVVTALEVAAAYDEEADQ